MRDDYLIAKAKEDYPWMEEVYKETSGFIHFSNKHIYNATKKNAGAPQTLNTYIGKYDHDVNLQSKIEAYACMIEISNCILNLIFGWVDTKRIGG